MNTNTAPAITTDPVVETDENGRTRIFWITRDGLKFEVTRPYKFDREGRSHASEGAVAQDGGKEINPCKRCGIPVVTVTSRRTGNDYQVNISRSHSGYWFYMKHDVHECTEGAIHDHHAQRNAVRLFCKMNNLLEVGAPVVVSKGRKFPIGTEGVVIWLAEKEDQWGRFRAGVKKEDGEVMWIDSNNITRTDQEEK